ncbi:MAG: sigma-70 family RNA polymerase sigma factor [Dysgonamonadaceae bacterium]|jgi:RNA polymerase sigma-70 factor (ECF subfamily)|nr:sigma-70 family RNA polymerase sigma factor [Dysgonamonadaceae bacterium]
MDERELIAGCIRKDNAARRYLYEFYARPMLGVCYRYTDNRQVSEDLLHDGFIRVFESIGAFEYRGKGSLKAWISKIFVNVSLEYLRANAQKPTAPLEEWTSSEAFREEELETVPTDVLMRFITELPTGYRTVFNLYVFEEMPHREIARLLHINEASSRSQLARAKSLLAKKIGEYINSGDGE